MSTSVIGFMHQSIHLALFELKIKCSKYTHTDITFIIILYKYNIINEVNFMSNCHLYKIYDKKIARKT